MINEETITLVNEQYNDALSMTKEMNHVCKSADNTLCIMDTPSLTLRLAGCMRSVHCRVFFLRVLTRQRKEVNRIKILN